MGKSTDQTLQEKMFSEMKDQSIFHLAKEYAFEYADHALDRHVFPTQFALDALSVFDEPMPEHMEDPEKVINLLHEYGSPATVSQIGGRYFGLVNGGVVPAGLAAKWLNDFWDQNTPFHATSPIVSKLEEISEGWLRQLLGLPENTVAGFVSGTSMAILCGLAAARFRIYQRLGWDINEKGLAGAPQLRLVAGKHIHSAVLKAVAMLGLGKSNIEWVDIDDQGRIKPEQVPELDSKTIVLLQAGNVNSGSFDPFHEICEKANEVNAWVHIDGAFGLWAAGSERMKHLTAGIELAHSWSVDGHKTLNTPYDSGIILCRDKEAMVSALQATGDYFIYGEQRDGMLYTPEMSRRARAVELWATLKYLGKKGLDELVYGLHERAVQFARELENTSDFEVLNDIVFNQVMVKCESDELTQRVMEQIQELRTCWVGGSKWNGQQIIRISVCSWATTAEDVSKSVASFKKAAELIKENSAS